MNNASFSLTAVVLAGLMSVSCATKYLWENTDYREQIFIPADKISEAELQRRGITYQVVTAESRIDPATQHHLIQRGGYLVDKTALQQLRDHAYRALATPVTLTFDTACVVSVVGVIGLYLYADDHVDEHHRNYPPDR